MTIAIRARIADDDDAMWTILEPIARAGDAFALPRDLTRDEALAYWNAPDHHVFVAENGLGIVAGTFRRSRCLRHVPSVVKDRATARSLIAAEKTGADPQS